jgi:hypothetical protein
VRNDSCKDSTEIDGCAAETEIEERKGCRIDEDFGVTRRGVAGPSITGEEEDGARAGALIGQRGSLETAMRMRGLEPPRGFPHTDLNRARLPIPPHPRGGPL